MNRSPRLLAAAAALCALLLARPAVAGPAADQLTDQIDQVVKTLRDPVLKTSAKTQERRQALRAISDNIFDWTEMAKRTLGRHWQGLAEGEREKFVRLFGDLLEQSYMTSIERYGSEKITILGEAADGEQAIVRTRIVTPRGQELPVDYRMIGGGDRWRVYDVVIEGVSLVGNYRTQFEKVIQTSSYQELVRKLIAQQLARRTTTTQ